MSTSRDSRSDGELIAAVLAGQKDQFAHLVRRYHKPLLNLAFQQLGEVQLAEDAVQDAFLNAFRWLSSYNSQYSFRTWLWTILKNACHRQYQQVSKKKRFLQDTENNFVHEAAYVSSNEPSAFEHLITQEDQQTVQELLNQLSDLQAEAIRLRFYGQMKFQEIANTLDCSLPAAKARVRQGLIQLAKIIKEQTPADSTWAEELRNV